MESGKFSKLDLKSVPDPGSKYKIGLKIGGGVGGDVHEAVESETGKKVGIKIIELKKETEAEIKQEYHVLKTLGGNENFPEFYGIFKKRGKDGGEKVWLVMEFCEGGTAADFSRKIQQGNKKISELHIAYIIRETIKAVIHLHDNEICHRDIRGDNVLLTSDGRVKLVDYGISKRVEKNKKLSTCVGSPCWMSPEMIAHQDEAVGYDKKADVWAIGITAIELGDGREPFEGMHPARVLFQIVQNPPPTLRKPLDWSQLYNDFINECLVKNPENRPYVQELLAHTFFESLDAEQNIQNEMKIILETQKNISLYKKPDVQVKKGYLRTEQKSTTEKILQEDLAALSEVSEDSVLSELHERFKRNQFHTFIGDILLILNPNKYVDLYGTQFHEKYRYKGKSQNAPHVYSIADSAYRDAFHHDKPQHVLFAGETGCGKTVNMMHTIEHLLFLGQGLKSSEKVRKALEVMQSLGNAATPHNPNSTRHVLQTQLTFTDTRKVSGAVFRLYQLEKERVTTTTKNQANFHLLYYFYDAMKSEGNPSNLALSNDKEYTFLKAGLETLPTKNSVENSNKYRQFENNLRDLNLEEEHIEYIRNILSAVLLLGEVEFVDDEEGNGVLTTVDVVNNVADMLGVDKKKLSWALLNYCLIIKGEAAMRHNSREEAHEAKNVLARGIYSRLVDWIVNTINKKLSVSRVIYGDRHIISLLDLYGFECYKRNTLDQLFVNTLNEQLQFQYNQKIFAWDKQTAKEEGIPFPSPDFNDNKMVIDRLMSKPDGLLYKIDEATRNEDSCDIIGSLAEERTSPVFAETSQMFSVNHYTGKLTYDASDMPEKNRDFLPPELIDTMRLSTKDITKQLFSTLLTKSGNLSTETGAPEKSDGSSEKKNAREKMQKVNTNVKGQYSQSRQMRTAATTFRGTWMDIFKSLTAIESGFHFVRCIRTDLSVKPGGFHPEVVRQQLKALGVVNTVLTIQQGYSYSVSHDEFIRRYKFLAFDFDENVEETKENCRLLLLRLKLEGWTMGKTKVFLKYYNKEYLSRLYETQIKKIVKVQSMMRAFMAKRKLYAKIRRYQVDSDKNKNKIHEGNFQSAEYSEAARKIQKKYREHAAGNKTKSGSITNNLNEKQKTFIGPWYKRWRTKSIFQVLLLYRADRLQTLVNFCLQIHLYNQNVLNNVQKTNYEINLEEVSLNAKPSQYLPPMKPSAHKVPFIRESLILRRDVSNCEPLPQYNLEKLESEVKANLNKVNKVLKENNGGKESTKIFTDKEIQTCSTDNKPEPPMIKIVEVEDSLSTDQIQAEEELSIPQNYVTIDQDAISNNAARDKENLLKEAAQESPITKMKLGDTKTEKAVEESWVSKDTHDENLTLEKPQDSEKPKHGILRKPQSSVKSHQQTFETPLKEMEEKFRQRGSVEHDDPPFNFRAMLRKTDFSKDLDRNQKENLIFPTDAEIDLKEKRDSLTCVKLHKLKRQSETTVTEIAPGILIHGKIADL